MSHNFNKSIFLMVFSCIYAGTPFEYTLGFTSGYDSNVMRFSDEEFNEASTDSELMGGANTFDSYVLKLGLSGKKTIWGLDKKEVYINGSFNWADYKNNPEKKYWSGAFDATYRWGSYKNIKYGLRHLNSFYLRHYVDRDISNKSLSPCFFNDRNQSIIITQKIKKNYWVNFGVGYLQRYYDKPFTEFDLDIIYFKGKINKRVNNLGSIAFQIDQGRAKSESHYLPQRPSSFDRSYQTLEWYVPIKINKRIKYVDEIGISVRSENRKYDAEDLDDPLHTGRSHQDGKYDFWVKKEMYDSFSVSISSRYRTRNTQSVYSWVTDLKSFEQLQIWLKVEWDLIYDRY